MLCIALLSRQHGRLNISYGLVRCIEIWGGIKSVQQFVGVACIQLLLHRRRWGWRYGLN